MEKEPTMVKVKFTPEGIAYLKNRHEKYRHWRLNVGADGPVPAKALEDFEAPETDENGYSTFTMDEFINTVGSHLSKEFQNIIFEDMIVGEDIYSQSKNNRR